MSDPMAKTEVDLIINARWIVPVVPRNTVYEAHSLVVNDGKIVALMPQQEATNSYQARETCQLDEHALMPGLVNAHGHAAMSLFRGLADDLPLMTWLNDHIWPAEAKWVDTAFVRDGATLAIAEMLRGGTTCFSDMYFFPEEVAEVADQIGLRAQVCGPILDFPTAWGRGPDEYIEKSLTLVEQYQSNPLITVALGPHAPYTVSDGPMKTIAELASQRDIPVQIHLHETAFEVNEAVSQNGARPIARLKDLGLISEDIALQCVHMTALNDDDFKHLTGSAATVIHCPESNLKLASGFCPVQALLDAGITVALGTDGAASNNDLDMFGELRTAALIAKPVAQNAAAVSAATAIEMATINGAKALGLDQTIGSLEVDKAADCIALRLDTLHCQPCFDVVSNIVYSATAHQVSDVWVAGKRQLAAGNLQHLDSRALIENARDWAEKINHTTDAS